MADFLSQAWPFAAAVLVILGIIALVFLVIILYRASKTMKSVQNIAADAEKEVTPALAKVNPVIDKAELLVDSVNLEILRVDSILEDVEQISNVAGKTANTVDAVTSAPAEAVTSLIDRIRGAVGTKRSDKLKQGRVVYPIGSGSAEDPAEEEAIVEENDNTIEEAAQKLASKETEAATVANTADTEAGPATDSKEETEPKAEDVSEPVGKHSVKNIYDWMEEDEPVLTDGE